MFSVQGFRDRTYLVCHFCLFCLSMWVVKRGLLGFYRGLRASRVEELGLRCFRV